MSDLDVLVPTARARRPSTRWSARAEYAHRHHAGIHPDAARRRHGRRGPILLHGVREKVGGSCSRTRPFRQRPKEPIMERRILGETGVKVAVLGFGCGAVGGLMVRGAPADQERAVARALELGINYFDTAPAYGDGVSEKNLGRVLAALRPEWSSAPSSRVRPEERATPPRRWRRPWRRACAASGASGWTCCSCTTAYPRRATTAPSTATGARGGGTRARQTAEPGQDPLLRHHRARRHAGAASRGRFAAFDTAQVCFNLLNPSAALPVPRGFPAHDFAGSTNAPRRRGWAPSASACSPRAR